MKEVSQTCEQILKFLLEGTYLEVTSELKETRSEVQQLRSDATQLRRLIQRSSFTSFYFLIPLLVLNASMFLYIYIFINMVRCKKIDTNTSKLIAIKSSS